jgi:hypothetical protein
MKPCKQISIPNVDNSEILCDGEYTNSKCVEIIDLSAELRVYFGLNDTPTLNEVLTAYGLSIIDARTRINTLEQ